MSSRVSPDDVLKFAQPTAGFLCPLSANVYGIEFLAFRVRDIDTNRTVFHVERDTPDGAGAVASPTAEQLAALTPEQEGALRTIRYQFPADFLKYSTVGTTLTFSVGNQPVPNFRMIELHYFKNRLVKSFDFNFGFCIPNSVNTWEAIYEMPEMTREELMDMVASPFESRSDSFYFVNDELVMHNKAEYSYVL
eukprot:PhM_4_TR2656/c0_g1_i1/m.23841